ncbi:hypothetical protein EIN_057690 [Entamoeba invadens IP1]|uniref:hypothetical protein n=1 Tax=Entamoeba invadens IP1 TaxID=370355 RepID=UPI0002C3EAAB|nr:hypothetical protein EIN_057690 [Entamoeba invadens IP1]ELP93364.1 hypothetical protein EIN_057690 [Entamoeba invadens IP1]|eukprot:XP_004260135.1 hypothetical protein EIN_057690 [Entamoeba invadens IP1]
MTTRLGEVERQLIPYLSEKDAHKFLMIRKLDQQLFLNYTANPFSIENPILFPQMKQQNLFTRDDIELPKMDFYIVHYQVEYSEFLSKAKENHIYKNVVFSQNDREIWEENHLESLREDDEDSEADSLEDLQKSRLVNIELPLNIKLLRNSAFENSLNLRVVKMADQITHIGNNTFKGCAQLSKINLSSKLVSIGTSAFYKCVNLKKIEFPTCLAYLGEYAFGQCKALTEVGFKGEHLHCVLPLWLKNKLPSNVKVDYVGFDKDDRALYEKANVDKLIDDNIVSVVIPNGVNVIGSSTFCGCQLLSHVVFPNSLVCLKDFCFRECRALQEVVLPPTLKALGYQAFFKCPLLKEVVIPQTVLCLGDCCFGWCKGLKRVKLPFALKSSGMNIFWESPAVLNYY